MSTKAEREAALLKLHDEAEEIETDLEYLFERLKKLRRGIEDLDVSEEDSADE